VLSEGARLRTDAELILASREDPRAFRELYDRWAENLLAYFYRRVLDPEVAADLLAETFAVAFEHRRRFRDIGRPGGAWLYGIAAKELAHFYRRQRVERRAVQRLGIAMPALDEESITRIEALLDAGQHRRALDAALGRMSAVERDAVELRVVQELDYREIAATLHCSEAAARTRVHRGLARLSELMEASS
jgi:RNA polymerase sigma-70 factor (ECF subfamily)